MPAKPRPKHTRKNGTVVRAARKPEAARCIVGIGASARNFEPVRALLGAELRATRRGLPSSIEDLEASNQDLAVAHGDVLSSNIELNNVNQQLQNKVAELESANSTLNNAIASSEIATLWLDCDLRIKWFTPAMQSAFHVMPTDAGRPVTDFGSPLTGAGLLLDVAAALDKLVPIEHEQITKDGRHYLRRIVPYRTDGGRLEGVIITFADVTNAWCNAVTAVNARKFLAETLEEQVRERTARLREVAFALTTADEQERRIFAQNLHDDLAQILTVAQIKLAELGKDVTYAGAAAALKEVKSLLEQASRTVHSLAFQLSPSVLYALGLMPAIDWLAEEMQRLHGLHVAVHDDGELKPVDERASVTLFRAVRELLVNVAKHARVNTAEVRGRREKNSMVIEVRDGGAGFDAQAITAGPSAGGYGLVSVRERIEMLGGSVRIDSLPGDGTTITLFAPLIEEDRAPAGVNA